MLLRGSSTKLALIALGVLTTGCAGAVGLGLGAAFIGAGALAYTCYDRVSVVVTDRVTGTQLCDAKVTFIEGKSKKTEATSCHQAALSAGKYRLHVERPGLVPYVVPIEVRDDGTCGQTVQTMYVALDRPGAPPQDRVATPPAALPAPPPAPPVATAPAAPPVSPPLAPGSAPPAGTAAPPNVAPVPGSVPAPGAAPVPAPAPTPGAAPAPAPNAAPAPAPTPSATPTPKTAPSAVPPAATFPDAP